MDRETRIMMLDIRARLAMTRAKLLMMDYEKDPDPENWRTINGSKVHLTNGRIDGGAGGKFSGNAWTGKKSHGHNSFFPQGEQRNKKSQNNTSSREGRSDIIKEITDIHCKKLIDLCQKRNIEYNAVKSLKVHEKEADMIEAVGGGDRTSGSCASAALAYIGRMQGLDVLDFRGGQSQSFFSWGLNLQSIMHFPGVVAFSKTARAQVTAANQLLKEVEVGKQYYFIAGCHAAIVRRTQEGQLQYLELQSARNNGWMDFNGNPRYTLNKRFGCTRKGMNFTAHMMDVDSLKNSKELRAILGFVNTQKNNQEKGAGGYAK